MKILLIDDDEINNFITKRLIQKIDPNVEITTALNGKFAIDLLETYTPDVVLLDTNMPVMNGFEFLDAIGKDTPYKIFMVASSVFSNDITRAKGHPQVIDFVSKPMNVEKLTEILNKK